MTHAEAADAPRGRRIRGLDAEQRREQRRRQLLESALELCAAHGYHNVSIEQLCQHAYVGTKSFYEIFPSREDCYIALVGWISEQIMGEMTAHRATAPPDAPDAERALIAAFAHALVDDPRRALVTFGQASGVSPAVERLRRANRRWAAEFVERFWRDSGTVGPDADVHRITIGLVGGLFDLVADWLLADDPAVDTLIEDLQAFYTAVRTGVAAR
ncbi:putative DNA-binding transcriptional regulator [Actinomadura rubteroloni]|uniref:Putative DNA-binding transcriptional regulator n=1 Tax=Actinomadura rubteroloni TaxID=1926885 RepID=A0A2P4UQS6_9ACTN|nr:TetR/AcrR family transcriptional regulator [Actinomadura rubteroloni]POM27374.1 putative DNA-binding transcriptional regulator [Actinomadura rubteroloni]